MLFGHSTERSGCAIINVNGLAFGHFLEIIKNGYFQKCLVLTDRDTDTKVQERAENLAEKYKEVDQIFVGISASSTFEKDLISENNTGEGRDVLLEVIKDVRPIAGKDYVTSLGNKAIDVDTFFPLIEEFKSEFAYSLLLHLDSSTKTFTVPAYISTGLNHLK